MSSKYSTLPDIDDQPDVFETDDHVENDHIRNLDSQEAQYSDDENEDVDKQGLPLKDAAARFQGAVVDASDTDFSDRLTRRRKAMYRTFIKRQTLETSEYELIPKDPTLQETSLQKLRRLQYELQELSDEVEKKKEDEVISTEVRQGDLLSQISYLQSDLSRISSSLTGRGDDDQDGLTAQAAEARQLIKQLEVYKNIVAADDQVSKEEDKADSTTKDANGQTLTYELFYNPNTAQHLKQAQIADIDSRIAKLEQLIGYSSGDNVESLPNNLSSTSIVALMSKLEKQMTVLTQPRHLDMISRRVKLVNSELDKLNELKHGKGEASNTGNYGSSQKNSEGNSVSDTMDDKINTLFNLMNKVEPMINITPAVLTRLKALQGLHTESATFSESIKMISEEQSKITNELENLGAINNQLQKTFQENEANIQANMKIMDDRMTELLRRINNLDIKS
ncbi:Dynamitin-domain-containing protein [Umbelopsis sp. PMI_123]|nr:Dynamitin-domain-containing protein [Umbelopsis sp. PMI_123]